MEGWGSPTIYQEEAEEEAVTEEVAEEVAEETEEEEVVTKGITTIEDLGPS